MTGSFIVRIVNTSLPLNGAVIAASIAGAQIAALAVALNPCIPVAKSHK